MSPTFTREYQKNAEAYLAEGKPWQARDYLMGLMGHVRYDEALYMLCGRTFLAMGEPELAGLYWAVTTDISPDAVRCIEAAQKKFGPKMLSSLRVYVKPSQLPADVQARLRLTLFEAGVDGLDDVFNKNTFHPEAAAKPRRTGGSLSGIILTTGCVAIFFIALFLFISGMISGIFFWVERLF